MHRLSPEISEPYQVPTFLSITDKTDISSEEFSYLDASVFLLHCYTCPKKEQFNSLIAHEAFTSELTFHYISAEETDFRESIKKKYLEFSIFGGGSAMSNSIFFETIKKSKLNIML